MIRNIFLICLVYCFIFSKNLYAETLHEVYALAQKNDAEFLSKIYQGDAQSENYYQMLALFFPKASFRLARTKTIQNIISADNQVFASGETSYPTFEYELTVRQSIYNQAHWEKLWQAETEEKKIAAELQIVKQDLILKVIERYFSVLNIREEYKSLLQEAIGLNEQYETIKTKLQSGLEKKIVLKKARAVYLDVLTRQEEARYKFEDAIAGLQEITGRDIQTLNELSTHFPLVNPDPLSVEVWVTNATLHNPEIIGQKEAMHIASQEIGVQKAKHYPTIDFVFSHGRRKAEGTLFGGGSDIEDTKMMFELNVPFLEGGAVMSMVRQAESLEKKGESELIQIKRKVKREARSAFNGVKISLLRINSFKELQEASEDEVNYLGQLYKMGIISSLETIESKRTLAKVIADYSNSRYEYVLSMMRLKRTVGILSEKDLTDLTDFFLGQGTLLSLPES